MLNLSASHIRTMRAKAPKQKLIWIDIGGGTGTCLLAGLIVFS